MKEAIQKAIEGGWKCAGDEVSSFQIYWKGNYGQAEVLFNVWLDTNGETCGRKTLTLSTLFIDPLFWQSLGKSLRWQDWFYSYYVGSKHTAQKEKYIEDMHREKGYCAYCGYWKRVDNESQIPEELLSNPNTWRVHPLLNPDWKIHWHEFIEHLAEGKKVEDFFNQLL